MKVKTEEDAQRNQVREDCEKLEKNVADIKAKRAEILDLFQNPTISGVLGRFDREVEEKKELLCNIDKKEFEKVQAEIRARRQLMATLRGAYQADLEEGERQLAEFKAKHSLFLQGEGQKKEVVNPETGEVSEAV
jgi:hypothetical protein